MSDRSTESYGEQGTTFVDRFGVWLSQRAIRRVLPRRNDLRVLELGCGYRATQLLALRDRLAHGTGVDFRIAPAVREEPGFSFFEGSIDEVIPKLGGQAFDAVLLISVLEHLAEPAAVLAAIRRLLRPGGVLLINVPTWRGKFFLELSAFRLGLSPSVEMNDHKMYYDKRDLWPLLIRAGFRPSDVCLRYHKFGLNLFATAGTPTHG
jgi:SAM-dependent methyltransferase